MEKDKIIPASEEIKTGPGSDPVNTFKEGSTGIKNTDIISSAVDNARAKSGSGLANDGTNVDYNEGANADYSEEK